VSISTLQQLTPTRFYCLLKRLMPLLVFNFKIHLVVHDFPNGKDDQSLSEILYIVQFIEHFKYVSKSI